MPEWPKGLGLGPSGLVPSRVQISLRAFFPFSNLQPSSNSNTFYLNVPKPFYINNHFPNGEGQNTNAKEVTTR